MTTKKLIAAGLSIMLVLGNASISFSAGEDIETAAPVVKTIAHLEFTGPTIELSLEQALKNALKSGSAIEAAEIKKKADAADARANAESLSSMESANQQASESGSFSGTTYGKTAISKAIKAEEYYRGMADRNYEAAKNQIAYSITNSYYTLLHAEKSLKIAQDSLRLQEYVLEITQKKFAAGLSPQQDVLQAEINVNSARAELASAEINLAEKKMIFNEDLGYEQMQDIKLTSPLERAKFPEISLESALSGALQNRNELYMRAYNVLKAELELESWRGYVIFSSVHKARNALLTAEKSYRDTENSIKREVRMNYANMINNQNQITNAELSAAKAEKSLEIVLAKYQLGMATVSEIHQAEIDSSKAEKSLVDVILKYNLSVLEYSQAATVGRSIN